MEKNDEYELILNAFKMLNEEHPNLISLNAFLQFFLSNKENLSPGIFPIEEYTPPHADYIMLKRPHDIYGKTLSMMLNHYPRVAQRPRTLPPSASAAGPSRIPDSVESEASIIDYS